MLVVENMAVAVLAFVAVHIADIERIVAVGTDRIQGTAVDNIADIAFVVVGTIARELEQQRQVLVPKQE